jgi:hypothetical protein
MSVFILDMCFGTQIEEQLLRYSTDMIAQIGDEVGCVPCNIFIVGEAGREAVRGMYVCLLLGVLGELAPVGVGLCHSLSPSLLSSSLPPIAVCSIS